MRTTQPTVTRTTERLFAASGWHVRGGVISEHFTHEPEEQPMTKSEARQAALEHASPKLKEAAEEAFRFLDGKSGASKHQVLARLADALGEVREREAELCIRD